MSFRDFASEHIEALLSSAERVCSSQSFSLHGGKTRHSISLYFHRENLCTINGIRSRLEKVSIDYKRTRFEDCSLEVSLSQSILFALLNSNFLAQLIDQEFTSLAYLRDVLVVSLSRSARETRKEVSFALYFNSITLHLSLLL